MPWCEPRLPQYGEVIRNGKRVDPQKISRNQTLFAFHLPLNTYPRRLLDLLPVNRFS